MEERKSGWEEMKKEDARHSYTQQCKNGRGEVERANTLTAKGFYTPTCLMTFRFCQLIGHF